MTLRVEEAEEELRELNRIFRCGVLKLPYCEEVLRREGFEPDDVVLVEVTPDGEGSFFGVWLTRDSRFLKFDLDADDPSFSTIIDVSDRILQKIRTKLRHKPWSPELVAVRLKESILDGV